MLGTLSMEANTKIAEAELVADGFDVTKGANAVIRGTKGRQLAFSFYPDLLIGQQLSGQLWNQARLSESHAS